MKKIKNIIGNLLMLFLVLLCVTLGYIKYQSITNPEEVPSVFGYKMLSVLSGSMSPTFEAGDFVVVKEGSKIQAGDIITYRMNGSYVTHRVEDILNEDGQAFYQTKGDANNILDQYTVSPDQIEGIYQWRLPQGAVIAEFFSSRLGWVFLAASFGLYFAIRALMQLHKKRLENSPDS